MIENNLKVLFAKILNVFVTLISMFMLVNVFAFLFQNISKFSNTLQFINPIVTIVYLIFVILVNITIMIQLIRFKQNIKVKKVMFYLSTIVFAFYISVLQEKMVLAYAAYFIVAVYFLLIFMLTRDGFNKEKDNKKIEIDEINKDKKLNKQNKRKTIFCSIILIVIIILVEIFLAIDYMNVLKISEKYNALDEQINELNMDISGENDSTLDTNQQAVTKENFDKALKREVIIFIATMIYLNLTVITIILAMFIPNKILNKINNINLWLLLIISAFMASDISVYYLIAPSVITYKILKENI